MILPVEIQETVVTTVGAIFVASITIIPSTIAAWLAYKSQASSKKTLHEVQNNGGMSDPDPTLKDYVRYVGENTILMSKRLEKLEAKFDRYLEEVHGGEDVKMEDEPNT